MSRRDIILISVLVNAGLLAVLFLTAVKSDPDSMTSNVEFSPMAVQEGNKTPTQTSDPVAFVENIDLSQGNLQGSPLSQNTLPVDEVDHVLKEYLPETQDALVLENDSISAPLEEEHHVSTETNLDNFSKESYVEVAVKRGDALEKIARANRTSVDAIKKVNNLANDKLKIGQVLKVPVGTQKAKTTASKDKPKPEKQVAIASSDEVFYTIKSGDNPWKIAKQNNVKFDDLLKLNNLNEEKAKNMKVGDVIRVK